MKTEELRCEITTVESERRVYVMHKNRRIEPKFEKMVVKKSSRSEEYKREESSLNSL